MDMKQVLILCLFLGLLIQLSTQEGERSKETSEQEETDPSKKKTQDSTSQQTQEGHQEEPKSDPDQKPPPEEKKEEPKSDPKSEPPTEETKDSKPVRGDDQKQETQESAKDDSTQDSSTSIEERKRNMITYIDREGSVQSCDKYTSSNVPKSFMRMTMDKSRKTDKTFTVRPAVNTEQEPPPTAQDEEEYKEVYLPLYMCDDNDAARISLEPLYAGCMRKCQMKESIKVTKVRLLSPRPYKEKLTVTWYSSVEMSDTCHEDFWSNEHRTKSSVPYTLSDNDIIKINKDISSLLRKNQDLIHGSYPKAECEYWQDTKATSIITRVRQTDFDLFFAPEINDYYIHIPIEQINVLQWDGKFDGPTGSYRWKVQSLEIPCLNTIGEEIICIGSAKSGDPLMCPSVGLSMEGPYSSSWDSGCHKMTYKDSNFMHFLNTGEKTMSYSAATQDRNPNVQSLSTAVEHIEEAICTLGCSELTLVTISNNTDTIVDTPVGVWKRVTGPGNKAVMCSTMSTGSLDVLTPICTLSGVVGVRHLSSPGTTYYWDMTKIYATTSYPHCLTDTLEDISPILRHIENDTFQLDTFIGTIEYNTRTGQSKILKYNEELSINKKRWFPMVALSTKTAEETTSGLEIIMMQQIRNLTAEYKTACQEASGPKIIQTVGGAIWILEKDIWSFWGNILSFPSYIRIIFYVICGWMILYLILCMIGLYKTAMNAKKVITVPVNYKRTRYSAASSKDRDQTK